jgi:hypothetical protein
MLRFEEVELDGKTPGVEEAENVEVRKMRNLGARSALLFSKTNGELRVALYQAQER